MRTFLTLLLLATAVAVPAQTGFASPVRIAQEGSPNAHSGGDSPDELRSYFNQELQRMAAEMTAMRKELAAIKSEMATLKKEMNRKL